jgi:hypothetical protein
VPPPENPVEITLNSAEDSSNLTITEHLGQSISLSVQPDSLFHRNSNNASVPVGLAKKPNSVKNNPFIEENSPGLREDKVNLQAADPEDVQLIIAPNPRTLQK